MTTEDILIAMYGYLLRAEEAASVLRRSPENFQRAIKKKKEPEPEMAFLARSARSIGPWIFYPAPAVAHVVDGTYADAAPVRAESLAELMMRRQLERQKYANGIDRARMPRPSGR